MSLAWPMLAAVGAAGATWLYEWSPARNPPDSGAVRSCDLPLPLILEMLSVAIRQGRTVPAGTQSHELLGLFHARLLRPRSLVRHQAGAGSGSGRRAAGGHRHGAGHA